MKKEGIERLEKTRKDGTFKVTVESSTTGNVEAAEAIVFMFERDQETKQIIQNSFININGPQELFLSAYLLTNMIIQAGVSEDYEKFIEEHFK